MLNIVIPLAGQGGRFSQAGYKDPKPLIRIHGRPMLEVVIRNIRPTSAHRFIFICLQEHISGYQLADRLQAWAPGCEVVSLPKVTEGAACTVLAARELICTSDPLMIANSDQWIEVDMDDYLAQMAARQLDGLIMTMRADHPKWSYVRTDPSGNVQEVVEKKVVSNEATVGVYNFSQGRFFVEAAEEMIRADRRTNNEFYVAPVYNEMIASGRRVGTYSVGSDFSGMYGLGTPEDLEKFLASPVSQKVVSD
jgi:NDP-sugar pyrophosphorylase family protein